MDEYFHRSYKIIYTDFSQLEWADVPEYQMQSESKAWLK